MEQSLSSWSFSNAGILLVECKEKEKNNISLRVSVYFFNLARRCKSRASQNLAAAVYTRRRPASRAQAWGRVLLLSRVAHNYYLSPMQQYYHTSAVWMA